MVSSRGKFASSHTPEHAKSSDKYMQRHNFTRHKHAYSDTLPLLLSLGRCVLCSAGSQCESQCVSLFFFFRRPSLLGLAICSPCCATRRSLWLQAFSHGGKKLSIGVKKIKHSGQKWFRHGCPVFWDS